MVERMKVLQEWSNSTSQLFKWKEITEKKLEKIRENLDDKESVNTEVILIFLFRILIIIIRNITTHMMQKKKVTRERRLPKLRKM
jgi:hypothetical protein